MTTPGPGDPVYDKVVALTSRVDVMLSRLDDLIRSSTDHEGRLRQLEQNRWPIANVTALVGIAALILAVIVAIYRK